jgi:NAD(P)-dependent dehydrogenase (short-subunit alcohol dehydrogenase family)
LDSTKGHGSEYPSGIPARAGEVVVITRVSAGLGRALAQEFARHGTRVGLIARGKERLERGTREVVRLGGEAVVLPADVACSDQVEKAAEQVEATFGPIDVWVNNAMTTVFAQLIDITPEDYRRATEVTYNVAVWFAIAAAKVCYRHQTERKQ